jgi:hypothetical protein
MNHRYSFRQYRAIDLAMFAVMLCIAEWLIVTAATRWYPDQLYTVSVVGAVTSIVLIRWGPWAAIHAALGGAVFCLASHGSSRQLLIYSVGNLLSLLMLLPLLAACGESGANTDEPGGADAAQSTEVTPGEETDETESPTVHWDAVAKPSLGGMDIIATTISSTIADFSRHLTAKV